MYVCHVIRSRVYVRVSCDQVSCVCTCHVIKSHVYVHVRVSCVQISCVSLLGLC